MPAEFIIGAATPELFPPESLPEFAFLGRSNVGKSTMLNCLAGKKLAFTSATPGRTRVINFFRVDGRYCFVDLPGYGYTEVPGGMARSWKRLVEAYLTRRQRLALCLLLVDARRGWTDKDLDLKRWLEFRQRRYLVVATKFDKLRTQRERHQAIAGVRGLCPGTEPVLFSALTGQGVREIWQAIWKTHNRP